MPETVVVHPLHVPGLPDRVAELSNVELVVPPGVEGVVGALEEGAEILVTYRWDDAFVTPGLRWVQSLSAGMEQYPLDRLKEAGVALTSARGVHAPAVAEHAIALLLAVVRRLGDSARDASDKHWKQRPTFEVGGRTLGVIGLGAVGERVAELAVGIGMRVIGVKADPTGYDGAAAAVFGPDGIAEVCAASDAVVVVLPGGDDTRGVVGARELAALGEGWLVNVGRGSAVDEEALVSALRDGALRGAGLDVFVTEPLPSESPLWDLDNVIITPHVAWSSDRLAGRMAERFVANLAAFRGQAEWIDRWT